MLWISERRNRELHPRALAANTSLTKYIMKMRQPFELWALRNATTCARYRREAVEEIINGLVALQIVEQRLYLKECPQNRDAKRMSSSEYLDATGLLPLKVFLKNRKLGALAFAPAELNNRTRSVVLGDLSQSPPIFKSGRSGRPAFCLHQHDVKQVSSFQDSARRFRCVFSDRDKVDHASPLPLLASAERQELPTFCNPRAERPEHDFRPTPSCVSFDMNRS